MDQFIAMLRTAAARLHADIDRHEQSTGPRVIANKRYGVVRDLIDALERSLELREAE